MKYLIVDDNEKFRKMIREEVCNEGDQVEELEDGVNVTVAYKYFQPDWVIMDIQLKVCSGFEATEKLLKAYPDAKILIVTDYTDNLYKKKALELGVSGFLEKENLFNINKIVNNSEIKR